MAKATQNKTAELFQMRLKEVDDEIAKQRKVVDKVKETLVRDDTEDNRKAVREAKEPMLRLTDERGDLARAIATALGARNFFPPA